MSSWLRIAEVADKKRRNALDHTPFEPTIVYLGKNGLQSTLYFGIAKMKEG